MTPVSCSKTAASVSSELSEERRVGESLFNYLTVGESLEEPKN